MDDQADHTSGWTPDWVIGLPELGAVAVANEAKDELIHHLLVFMHETYDHGYGGRTIRVASIGRVDEWQLNAADGRERPRLWVVSRDNSLVLFVAGQGDINDEDIEIWRLGVDTALSTLGSKRDVSWVAILSQAQLSPLALSGDRLSEPTQRGTLSFQLLDGCIAEDSPLSSTGTGVMVGERSHWPIKVEGSTSCYSWEKDGEWRTLQRLRKISALLSVAWESCWTLREGPRDPKFRWANSAGPLMGRSWRTMDKNDPLALGRSVAVPEWLDGAEDHLERDNNLTAALLMHHEGLMLTRDHSSLALVCFIAAVETVAQINKKPERCPECKSVLGSAKRFKDAIRAVLDGDQFEALAEAYSKRSLTVHQGRLYGAELRLGSWGQMSLFLSDPIPHFEMGTVRAAQGASRKLIFGALGVPVRDKS
jgi:hypothetical protein